MLDNYLLKSTYEAFLTAYGEFKTSIEGRADAAEAEIDTLNAGMEEMTKGRRYAGPARARLRAPSTPKRHSQR